MSWLTVHMLWLLGAAAFFGGLIGWWMRRNAVHAAAQTEADASLKTRISQLETQLDLERKTATDLKSRITSMTMPEEKVEILPASEEDQSMAWRNRYLESRNRFLEQKAAELEDVLSARAAAPEAGEAVDRLSRRNTYLEGRVKYLEEELVRSGAFKEAAPAEVSIGLPTATLIDEPKMDGKPQTLAAPRNGRADDLKEIAGVGPKIESLLNGLGIYHFDQIAAWGELEVAWVNAAISFKGRIEREKWVEQARALARGDATDGQTKYREGKHT